MAEEGGEVSGRREYLIQNCSPCSDNGTEKAATKYCFMCETSFCQDCTEQHNVFLSKHRVTEIESANIGVPVTFNTEPCPEHGRALTLYCKDDDSISCEECFRRKHISCKEVVFLPSTAQEVIKNIDVTEIKSKLMRTIKQLEKIKLKQQATVTSLEADREKCLQAIDDHHEELLDLLVKIVQSSKDQVVQTFERLSADLQRHRQEVEQFRVYLQSSEKRIERYQGNDFPLFVELKKCQTKLKFTEEVSTASLNNLEVRGFSVALDDRVHNLLRELGSLVTVLNKEPAPSQVKKKYKIDVKIKADRQTCNIYGSCVLQDGSILLADYDNKMLKCLDQYSLKVTDQCPIQDCPGDVCVINNSEVAVTQGNTTLVIVSVRPRLTPTRTISMNHTCGGLAYCQGELFITDLSKTLYIYNMEDSLLRKVSTDPSGQDIFSKTRHIAISGAADKVYIADSEKGVIILDREGQVQDKMVIDKIRGTFGMCLDGIGGLFVCGFNSHNVVHVGADGQILTEVLTSSDGLMGPSSVCYDRLHKRLIVTQFVTENGMVEHFVPATELQTRSCKDAVYLPISAHLVIKNIDVSDIKSKLKRTIEQLESIKINQQATVTSLEADRDRCMDEIDGHHTELLALLERIVQSSKDQVIQTFERFIADLQRYRQEVEKCLVDLESSEKRLERYQGIDFPLFVELKKCQTQLKMTEEVSTDSLDNLKVRGFSVVLDDRVHILLSELESLVTVFNKASAPAQVKKKYKIGVKVKADRNACSIYGSCVLQDGSILLADCFNTMLKCVDQHSLKVTDQCPMQNRPRGVCIINSSEVAVTQDNNTVVIVSVKPRLTPTRTISMNHTCGYVAYFQGELFITDCGKSLYIYNMEGSLLRKVSTDPSGQDIFSQTRHITISGVADKVYIADRNKGVIVLDRAGQVQDKLVIDKIRDTWGLCLDGMGGLFVCGFHSDHVVHVGTDGQFLTEVLTSSDGLRSLLSVCYDRQHKRLIVTQNYSNQIHVCELQ